MLEVNARIGYNARQYPVSSPIQKSATLMMPQDLQAHMRKVSYLEALSEAECRELARRCQARTFGNAELIFTEGAPADGLWLVERGSVKVFKLGADGTEHILHLLARGNTFNEIAALDGGVNPPTLHHSIQKRCFGYSLAMFYSVSLAKTPPSRLLPYAF